MLDNYVHNHLHNKTIYCSNEERVTELLRGGVVGNGGKGVRDTKMLEKYICSLCEIIYRY